MNPCRAPMGSVTGPSPRAGRRPRRGRGSGSCRHPPRADVRRAVLPVYGDEGDGRPRGGPPERAVAGRVPGTPGSPPAARPAAAGDAPASRTGAAGRTVRSGPGAPRRPRTAATPRTLRAEAEHGAGGDGMDVARQGGTGSTAVPRQGVVAGGARISDGRPPGPGPAQWAHAFTHPDGRLRPRHDPHRLPARHQGRLRGTVRRDGVYIDADLAVSRLGPPLEEEMRNWFPAERDRRGRRPLPRDLPHTRDRADARDGRRPGGRRGRPARSAGGRSS